MLASTLSLALLVAMSLNALWLRRHLVGHERWLVTALLLVTAGIWLRADGPLEGPVLWVASSHHGLTLGDFAVALPVAAIVALAATGRRRLHQRSPARDHARPGRP